VPARLSVIIKPIKSFSLLKKIKKKRGRGDHASIALTMGSRRPRKKKKINKKNFKHNNIMPLPHTGWNPASTNPTNDERRRT
jgi:hypothetical protein